MTNQSALTPSSPTTDRDSLRREVGCLMNAIDRIKDRKSTIELTEILRFVVLPSISIPGVSTWGKWDLCLTDSPQECPEFLVNRTGEFWKRCDDREFLQGLANIGNAYINIGS